MDYKKVFEKYGDENFFVKKTTGSRLDDALKIPLNRKGNALYNQGKIEDARRIFITTGYSDGLSRIGDYYKSQGRFLDALKMYWIAPDRAKAEPIIIRLSEIIRNLTNEEEGASNE
jgi:tetratricopeptide (TPR) repeat protein